jgi:hypothetical protein
VPDWQGIGAAVLVMATPTIENREHPVSSPAVPTYAGSQFEQKYDPNVGFPTTRPMMRKVGPAFRTPIDSD